MAILNFLNKKKEETALAGETFTPKPSPPRGPGGRFISSKKLEESKLKTVKETQTPPKTQKPKTDQTKIQGPFMIPFAGKEIRKYFVDGQCYFSVQELIFLLLADPPVGPLEELKIDPRFKELFEKEIRTIDGFDCADGKGTAEILRAIIKNYKATFPGSLFRWLEDISAQKPETEENKAAETPNQNLQNPSERNY